MMPELAVNAAALATSQLVIRLGPWLVDLVDNSAIWDWLDCANILPTRKRTIRKAVAAEKHQVYTLQ